MKEAKYLTDKDFNEVLPAEVKALYEVKGIGKRTTTTIVTAKHGKVDFATISLAKAKSLVAAEFPFLIERKKTNA